MHYGKEWKEREGRSKKGGKETGWEMQRETMSSGKLGACEGWPRHVAKRENGGRRERSKQIEGVDRRRAGEDGQEGRWFCH